MGSRNALIWMSSALAIHHPQTPGGQQRSRMPKHPRFSSDSYMKLQDEFLFIWQQAGTLCWRSRRCVRALAIELRR